jgi:hypothetical protein
MDDRRRRFPLSGGGKRPMSDRGLSIGALRKRRPLGGGTAIASIVTVRRRARVAFRLPSAASIAVGSFSYL